MLDALRERPQDAVPVSATGWPRRTCSASVLKSGRGWAATIAARVRQDVVQPDPEYVDLDAGGDERNLPARVEWSAGLPVRPAPARVVDRVTGRWSGASLA
ncbi:MAG TPA: hypothetical protein VFT31_08905 [Kribbella sp.]|nr:hypothetical protein [Kribbella sp.]